MIQRTNTIETNPAQPLDRLVYTVKETAALLRVSDETVYRLIKRGKLRAVGSIRHKLIPRAAIEALLK